MNNKKINPQNLYDVLDEKTQKENQQAIQECNDNIFWDNIIRYGFNILKICLIVAFVGFVFNFRYSSFTNIRHNVEKYFDEFDGKTHYYEPYPVQKQVDEFGHEYFVPDVRLTGTLRKDDEFYITFKYRNKVHTLKEGDTFGDNYTITKVYHNAMEMIDKNGEVFKYSM